MTENLKDLGRVPAGPVVERQRHLTPAASGQLHIRGVAKHPIDRLRSTVSGITLGQVRLGMTRSQAERAYSQSVIESSALSQLFCVAPDGVRVGYPSQQLLAALPAGQRNAVAGRVIWASTSNPLYAIDGIRSGDTLTAAEKTLPHGTVLHIGQNEWYLVSAGPVTAVLQVSQRGIVEIGIIRAGLTKNARDERIVISSLR